MEFKSAKTWQFGFVIWGVVLLMIILVGMDLIKYGMQFHVSWFVCMAAAGFLLWLWFGTGYLINEGKLFYRSGPIRGSLKVSDIHTLIVNKTLWIGMKPALATRGIIVKYGCYDELYISPENKDAFIDSVRKLNGEIKVIAAGN